ncbi:hypothetical protein [Algivirga pacifica]|uniref:GNAT family N-acetyltransferase n=1 Tax=Algivirga pacifica TaxID=1162670 RepID=A0ABP9D649_9BACT
MQLIEVTEKKHIKEFLEFPVRLYKEDPNYIRPLNQDVEAVFDPKKNKLFKQGGKAIRWILKNDQGETIGRVAAYHNPKTAYKTKDLPTGGMGFFDCINDQEAANILFNACKSWLQEFDMEAMDGPINFGDRDRWWGCLKEGFTEPNYCMHYNFPYYNDLYEAYGFKTYFKQFTYLRRVKEKVDDELIRKGTSVYTDPDYTFIHARKKDLEKFAIDFATIYNKAWKGHPGVPSISEKAAKKIFGSLKMVMDEELAWFGYYKGEPVAFYLQIPEMNQIVKKIKSGNLNLWNKLRMFWYIKTRASRKIFGLVFGVIPEHQKKGVECAIVMAYSDFIVQTIGKKHNPDPKLYFDGYHYKSLEMNWIGDFNPKMMRTVELIGGEICKVHLTYRKLFDENRPFERMKIIQ